MNWFTEQGADTGFQWLCVFCTDTILGYDPDMGDMVDWKPGKCQNCGRELTIFTPVI